MVKNTPKRTVPVWHKVLTKYTSCRGTGLSVHALVHITGIPWPELRKQIVERDRTHGDVYTYRCGTVAAELITVSRPGRILSLPLIDKQVAEYDPAEWAGFENGNAVKTLTVYGGEPTLEAMRQVVADYVKRPKTKQPK